MKEIIINSLKVVKFATNSNYLAQFHVFDGDKLIGYIKFDDGYFSASYNEKEIFYARCNYENLSTVIDKAVNLIKELQIKEFLSSSASQNNDEDCFWDED